MNNPFLSENMRIAHEARDAWKDAYAKYLEEGKLLLAPFKPGDRVVVTFVKDIVDRKKTYEHQGVIEKMNNCLFMRSNNYKSQTSVASVVAVRSVEPQATNVFMTSGATGDAFKANPFLTI